MKISIVGCGGISRTHIGAVREIPDARIISVADCIPERAEAAAKQCGAKAYTSLEDMLAGEKPDVLHICTPHYLHVPMAVYAMERGVDVLCEKPCAMTEGQLEELRECQRRTRRQFGVCFQNRYNRSVQYLKTVSVFAEFSQGFRGVFFATTANAVTSSIMLEANFADRSVRIEGDSVFELRDGKLTQVFAADKFDNHGKLCWGSGHAALIRDFYDAVRNNRPFAIDADEGGKAVELLLAVYKSAETGERIEL